MIRPLIAPTLLAAALGMSGCSGASSTAPTAPAAVSSSAPSPSPSPSPSVAGIDDPTYGWQGSETSVVDDSCGWLSADQLSAALGGVDAQSPGAYGVVDYPQDHITSHQCTFALGADDSVLALARNDFGSRKGVSSWSGFIETTPVHGLGDRAASDHWDLEGTRHDKLLVASGTVVMEIEIATPDTTKAPAGDPHRIKQLTAVYRLLPATG